MRESDTLYNPKDNIADKLFVDHIKNDPVFNKRQKRILEYFLTKEGLSKINNFETIKKTAMYFGYNQNVVLKDFKHISIFYENAAARAIENAVKEYEQLEAHKK